MLRRMQGPGSEWGDTGGHEGQPLVPSNRPDGNRMLIGILRSI